MGDNQDRKHTVLYDRHVSGGANMALFGGYEMPLWYKTGVKAEHLAVLQRAGIFDTSHMAAVAVSGSGARDLLQRCISKDLERAMGSRPLVSGRCVYGVILLEDGTVLDDAITYMFGEEEYLVVVNAGMGGRVAQHFLEQNSGVQIEDLTDRLGKMDIQGPMAAKVLRKILSQADDVLEDMIYFSFKGSAAGFSGTGTVETTAGIPVMLSRTGYTGEFGFELFCSPEDLPELWDAVAAAGEEFGLVACGLASRDSLRAGAVLPLSHQDIGDWPFLNNPWQFALPWQNKGDSFSKDFIGSESLVSNSFNEFTLPFAGYDPRKIPVTENSCVLNETGEKIGRILTCTTDMALDRIDDELASVTVDSELQPRGLSCGFVILHEPLRPGDKIVLTDGKRKIPVEIREDIRPGRTARAPMSEMIQD